MRRATAFLAFGLALLVAMLSPRTGVLAQSSGAGPTAIEQCQTINNPGSYRLVNDLIATGDCLLINADNVTLDLAGFQIGGNGSGTAIGFIAPNPQVARHGIAVRNGTISGFHTAIDFYGDAGTNGAIIEGLRISGMPSAHGILANSAIVRSNTVQCGPGLATGITTVDGTVTNNVILGCENGIDAVGGLVSGNDVRFGKGTGINIQGGMVLGNTVEGSGVGISAACPSNITDNWTLGTPSLKLTGTGCKDTNNVTR